MKRRQEFLRLVWDDIINAQMRPGALANMLANVERKPAGPFGDVAPVIRRLLAGGGSERDVAVLMRFTAYEACFELLYMLGDPGVEGGPSMLHEGLLSADPGGLEGRPGSAP